MKIVLLVVACGGTYRRASNESDPDNNQPQTVTLESQPIYRVTVVSRTAKAVNYRHRGGAPRLISPGLR